MNGVIVKFDEKKGFGFIRTDDHDDDIFVHIKNVKGNEVLEPGQKVSFGIKYGEKGAEAVKVKPGGKQTSPFVFFSVSGLAIVAVVMYILHKYVNIHWTIAYFVAVNISVFLLYGYDKRVAKAQKGGMRIPENTLHFFAFIGGTPMAFVSRRFFRHKTVKVSFVVTFWIVFIVQVIIIWKFWPLIHS
ncbi:DUF1294 domain-containing protein [Candidatus Uabimicrobium amorphum]|uniref:Cold-shock protein n=1 Tax=Uabimicrobium amorphum TaxID=2596890 RepID=A0A5S9IJ61_UABAM|nr:cold shock and DUF1294 domain-containing protein [Candidatus Uabimicrobium amorphum]BBM82020.1 cold-shock protein [Candidatus Uabimicrobium amorphum]